MAWTGIEPMIAGSRVRHANHSATLPLTAQVCLMVSMTKYSHPVALVACAEAVVRTIRKLLNFSVQKFQISPSTKNVNKPQFLWKCLQAKWRLFGHVLRREPSIPANKAFYFHDNAMRAGGRPIMTLPMTLNNDLKILQNRSISLTSHKDLEA
ncbi:hypothetical protein ElyMa_003213500 [Elysia marginata]|uniref:Uncharacterized protein n=1 Tax=Elysia marginata TaxID=1093978 RepID=A0AAV4J0V6_9GAST|nr:hypothetical protein ElyMa_003213500 [Elysia marginata]